ncbi:hypothetical protein AGMMS50230_13380 [Spirochaetia bacterium]|nr:hypothetical protein AGMMS50230_13380 [Spirochaetia bacterium]
MRSLGLFIRCAFLAAGFLALTLEAAAQAPDTVSGSPLVTDLSLYNLIQAAGGAGLLWRPDWPLELPPDLFYAAGETVSISVGNPVSTKVGNLVFSRDGEKIRSFPVLINSAAGGPALFQGLVSYDKEGRLARLSWENPAQSPAPSSAAAPSGQDSGQDAEVLQWDGDGRPVLFRIFAGDYYFAALEYTAGSVIETWYNRDGAALFVLITGPAGRLIMPASPPQTGEKPQADEKPADGQNENRETKIFYNSNGRISRIEDAAGTAAALYTTKGMPRYLELLQYGTSAGTSENTVENAAENTAAYTYQWDEAGRLVRLSREPANADSFGNRDSPLGDTGDYRYEYTLDSRGNWIERREITMGRVGDQETGERSVPVTVKTIRRTIRYGK